MGEVEVGLGQQEEEWGVSVNSSKMSTNGIMQADSSLLSSLKIISLAGFIKFAWL